MLAFWLELSIVVVLALAGWISSIDATGDPTATWLLWAATGVIGAFTTIRMLAHAR